MVYLLLGTGFEETEAVAPCDLLRRAGVEVRLVGLDGKLIRGSHGIWIQADLELTEVDPADVELLILPGGLGGVRSLLACAPALALTKRVWEDGKKVAAICAAPTILAQLGIVGTRKAVCYPGMEAQMGEARMQDAPAVVDGNLITGRSAGAALDFGLTLVRVLKGPEAAAKVAGGVVYPAPRE